MKQLLDTELVKDFDFAPREAGKRMFRIPLHRDKAVIVSFETETDDHDEISRGGSFDSEVRAAIERMAWMIHVAHQRGGQD